MSISELNKNVWGKVALFLEELHPFVKASKACKKIAEDSLYPAFWREYLKLGHLKPYAEKFESLPSNAAKVRALFESLLKEIRGIAVGQTDPPNLPRPKLKCSLHPVKLTEFTRFIANEQNRSLVTSFQAGITPLPRFLKGVDPNTDDCTAAAEELHRWLCQNLSQLRGCIELNISESYISLVPKEIALFQSLTYLSCENNGILTFPEAATCLCSLKSLHLGRNLLFELPASMCKLSELETLSLYKNRFLVVPDSIYTLRNLTELFLEHNKLTNISSAIGSLRKLKELGLNDNLLTALPAEMAHLRDLKELDLRYNLLKGVPRALKNSDIPAIRDNPEIKQAAEIPPTLCEQVCAFFWSIWSWFINWLWS